MADNGWFEGERSPGAGDLGQMHALRDGLAVTAEAARAARRDLAGLRDQVGDAVWRGPAAAEFRNNISDKFLGQLQQLDASYQNAADGFSSYIAAVSQIKDRALGLAGRIYAAQSRYEWAASALQEWAGANPQSVVSSSGSLSAPAFGEGSPLTVHVVAAPTAGPSPVALQREVDDAWGELQSLYRQMHELQTNDRVAADNAVIAKLDQAHDAGIKNESAWHHFFHTLATVAKWVGIALVVVAVVVAICLAPELGLMAAFGTVFGTTGATVGGLAVGSIVTYGGAVASLAALVGDAGEAATGDGPGGWNIALDAVGALPLAGRGIVGLTRLAGWTGKAEHVAEAGTSTASRLSLGTEWASGKLPLREGPADGLLIKRGLSGEIANYSEYDSSGYITKRVDLTGRSHAGIPTPHAVDYVNDVSPSGQIFPRGLPVRPATPDEIP